MIKKLMLMLMVAAMTLCNAFAYENLNVEYLGDTEKLFKTNDDFFVNIPAMLPGDVYKDKAVLFNKSNSNINLYFKTEPFEKEEYELEEDYQLLEKIQLSIYVRKNNELINLYEGSLGSKDFTNYRNIGSYLPNEKADFIFYIEVPAELKNEFDMTRTKVKWIFGVEKEEIEKDVLGDTINSKDEKNQINKNKVNVEKETINSNNIKTGDDTKLVLYATLGICALLFFFTIRKESKKDDKKDI